MVWCVVNSLKNHTDKILDVWSKIIKQPKTTLVTVIITSKNRKHREKKKERTHGICLPNSVKYWPSLGEREVIRSTIMMSNFTKEISKGYKNQYSNLILPKVLNLFPWPKDFILVVFLQGESIPTLVFVAKRILYKP